MTSNTNNKNQCDDTIEYDPKFDDKFSLSSGTNKYHLPVVTFRLIGGKKHRATIISGLTVLWDSVVTNIITNRQNIKPYKSRMCYNKVGYTNDTEPYCTTHNVKAP